MLALFGKMFLIVYLCNMNNITTANEIIELMLSMRNDEQACQLMRFFKTGKGQYGEGDKFLGLKVPQTRAVVREAKHSVPLCEVEKLVYSEWHEVRLCGFLILVDEMKAVMPTVRKAGDAERRRELKDFYLRHARQANNWDLVDLTCQYILGFWLLCPDESGQVPPRDVLHKLVESDNLWEQRIAIVSTLALIRTGEFEDAVRLSTILLTHKHDLIHKAVGWMLREIGKRDMDTLRDYLEQHVHDMPRTTLRYAIERMGAAERLYWLGR